MIADMLKDFFIPDINSLTPVGYLSPGHLIWSVATIIMLSFEFLDIILDCVRAGTISELKSELPFYLCSTQFINQPIACWGKGKVKETAKNFLFIWGFLNAIFGVFLDAGCFAQFPLMSYEVLRITVTHCISGFGALYVAVSGQIHMKKKDILPVMAEYGIFLVVALICAWTLNENYMFFLHDSGTPFHYFYLAVKGNMVLYDISVAFGMSLYALLFWGIYMIIVSKIRKKKDAAV